jgi:hypothetical protein
VSLLGRCSFGGIARVLSLGNGITAVPRWMSQLVGNASIGCWHLRISAGQSRLNNDQAFEGFRAL